MDTDTDQDALFLDAVETVVLATLDRIGRNPEDRFQFFKRLLAAAQEAATIDDSSFHPARQCSGEREPVRK